MAVPKKKTSKSKTRSRRASAWKLRRAGSQRLPALRHRQDCRTPCARPAAGTSDRVVVDVG